MRPLLTSSELAAQHWEAVVRATQADAVAARNRAGRVHPVRARVGASLIRAGRRLAPTSPAGSAPAIR